MCLRYGLYLEPSRSRSREQFPSKPSHKKGLSAWQQDQVDTRCFLGKEFSGTPARAKRLSGPVYFNLFYQWLGLKVTQKTVFVLHVFVLKLTVESHKTRLSDSDRQGYLNPQPCQRSSYWGEKKKQAPSCRQTTENTSNLKIYRRGALLLPKNSLSNLQKGSGPKPQELLWCRARTRWAPATRTNQPRQASCFHSVALISASI